MVSTVRTDAAWGMDAPMFLFVPHFRQDVVMEQDANTKQRLADGAACHAAALEYLALGWSVLICCPPDHVGVGKGHAKGCASPGKAPWGQWKEYQDRLASVGELKAKWRDLPNGNVGLAMGPVSGLVGIDVDGPVGEETLQQLSGGDLPKTLEFITPGGGRRLLYAIPDGAKLRTTVRRPDEPQQEVRFQARGAQTVLPPSRHASGGLYRWVAGHGPNEIAAARAPAWLVEQLRDDRPSTSNGAGGPVAAAVGGRIIDGGRNDTLISLAGTMRRRGMGQAAILAALTATNEEQCDPPLEQREVESIAASIMRYQPEEALDGAANDIDDRHEQQQAGLPNRVKALRFVQRKLKIDLAKIIRVGTERPNYDFLLQDGQRLRIGNDAVILSAPLTRRALFGYGILIEPFKGDAWTKIARAFNVLMETVETLTDRQQTEGWLEHYAAARMVGRVFNMNDTEEVFEAVEHMTGNGAVIQDSSGTIYLGTEKFKTFLYHNLSERIGERELVDRLKTMGFNKIRLEPMVNRVQRRVRAWQSPPGYADEIGVRISPP